MAKSGEASTNGTAVADTVGSVPELGPMNMVSLVRVPTKIGPVCAEDEAPVDMLSVGVKREGDGKCLLWATNGRMCAVVPAEVCDYGTGQHPRRLPATLAVPTKDGARELRCGVGTKETIFGFERVWVDEDAGRFAPEPMSGKDPNMGGVFPFIVGGECLYIALNAELLLTLVRAVNSPNGPNGVTNATLAINLNDKMKPVVVIGDEGVGVLMPRGGGDEKMDSPRYTEIVKRLRAAEKAGT